MRDSYILRKSIDNLLSPQRPYREEQKDELIRKRGHAPNSDLGRLRLVGANLFVAEHDPYPTKRLILRLGRGVVVDV